MNLVENHWIDTYRAKGALWLHGGPPDRPHALLTSGNHSNGFFNSELVLENPLLMDEASYGLVELLRESGLDLESVDRVVGPAMGAITLAHDVARQIARRRSYPCLRAYAEKRDTDSFSARMHFSRTRLIPGERVLLVEDVITTGGSVERTAHAVHLNGGTLLPFVATLVNRSGQHSANGLKIVALIDRAMPIWKPEECELCKAGSIAVRPKEAANWALLTAA